MKVFGRIEVHHPDAQIVTYSLSGESISIGRSATNYISINSEGISRQHVVISSSDGNVTLRDLGSRNGTYLDGKRVDANIEHPLADGQEIIIGKLKIYYFNYDENDKAGKGFDLETEVIPHFQIGANDDSKLTKTLTLGGEDHRIKRKVFVSYRKADGDVVHPLCDAMRDWDQVGEVWVDTEIKGGQRWWDTILEQIQKADLIVIALSNAYLDSVPCQREYDYVKELGKVMLPVKVSDDLDFKRLRKPVSEIQIIDATTLSDDIRDELHTAVNTQPYSPPLPDPLPPKPDAPLSPLVEVEELANQSTISNTDEDTLFSLLFEIMTVNTPDADELQSAHRIIDNLLKRSQISFGFARKLQKLRGDSSA